MPPQVSIIGLGNWGSSLARAVTVAKLEVGEIIQGRTGRGRHAQWTRALPLVSFDRACLDAKLIWLCVPDSAIAKVAAQIVKQRSSLNGQIVIHSSGALSAQALKTVEAAGASIGAAHPMMTFPTRTPIPLAGVPFAVEAEASTRRTLNSVIRRIGGWSFAIEPGSKPFYHLAGMLSSPLLASYLVVAQEMALQAGLTPRQAMQVIEPITRATVDNFFRRGAGKSFSGPIARGDIDTIRLHLQTLDSHPMVAGVYRSLALHAVDALPATSRSKLRATLLRKW
jgi:predicted short-subunit dehydrogenase-like oxidoreductase (DUF2520 family)